MPDRVLSIFEKRIYIPVFLPLRACGFRQTLHKGIPNRYRPVKFIEKYIDSGCRFVFIKNLTLEKIKFLHLASFF